MARPQTKGFRSMNIATDLFNSDEARMLLHKFGLEGYGAYLYLTTAMYRTEGYYLRWDEIRMERAAADMYADSERVETIVEYCLKMGLLKLVTVGGETYLTSETIQRQFQKLARRGRKVCECRNGIWLLPEEETDERIFNPDILSGCKNDKKAENKAEEKPEEKPVGERRGEGTAEMEATCSEPINSWRGWAEENAPADPDEEDEGYDYGSEASRVIIEAFGSKESRAKPAKETEEIYDFSIEEETAETDNNLYSEFSGRKPAKEKREERSKEEKKENTTLIPTFSFNPTTTYTYGEREKNKKEKDSAETGREKEAMERFFATYPQVLRDTMREEYAYMDFTRLCEEFGRSKKLRDKCTSMAYIHRGYDGIISGSYRDPQSDADAMIDFQRFCATAHSVSERQADENRNKALQNPEYKSVHCQLSDLNRSISMAEIRHDEKERAALIQKQQRLERQRVSILARMGMTPEDLKPRYHCKKCNDTGFLPDGRACGCYKLGNWWEKKTEP